jgi:hemerythrin-like domain-containing protein
MEPVGPLMHEHRLIERMIALAADEAGRVEAGERPNQEFVEAVVDFIRTYADRTHHGKEEDILFRELEGKDLSPKHRDTMERLKADHRRGREITAGLDAAAKKLRLEAPRAVAETAGRLRELVEMYPEHIRVEDEEFFHEVLDYFTPEERQAMLDEENEFDRGMIHERYRREVEGFEPGK